MSTTKIRSALSGAKTNLRFSVRHSLASRPSSAQYVDAAGGPTQEERKMFIRTRQVAAGNVSRTHTNSGQQFFRRRRRDFHISTLRRSIDRGVNERCVYTWMAHACETNYRFASACYFEPRQNLAQLAVAHFHPNVAPPYC